ncbi:hypothetical protein BGZ65_001388 [Modicella reniformis]|uniref:Secreted protein n=1 Tax=Modicella reniformis TaxID=1440133 RepID=A0A9P6MA39_9FUNG|nr:hypothetical protein BGZ65_001388 [Modicella reniformis]
MKTTFFPLAIALISLTFYTSAAPTPVIHSKVSSNSLRSAFSAFSPATDRRTAPIDLCQPGRPDSGSNPICNPNNYHYHPPNNGDTNTGESHENISPSNGSHSSEGHREQSQNQQLDEKNDEARIVRENQRPNNNLRKRYTKERAQGR